MERRDRQIEILRRKIDSKKKEKRICLTMIVRNESANMTRLLDSLEGTIQMACITDTGSSDSTKEITIAWFNEKKIPLTLLDEPFVNFGYNRTKALESAKISYPQADFFLLSDADFIWENKEFHSGLCIDDAYMIKQGNDSLSYFNIRLLSSRIDWHCVGVTHEFWEAKDPTIPIRRQNISTLSIIDMDDGGHKFDKFQRDERLLKDALAEEDTPNSLRERYEFYLGNTLKTLGKYEESIEHYSKRISAGGFAEEIFHAKMETGACYEMMAWKGGDNSEKYFKLAAINYRNAHNFRPSRAESLARLAKMFRTRSLHVEALKVAEEGKTIPYPTNDILFISDSCYTYEFDIEISICAYYVPDKKNEGRDAIVRLLEMGELLPHTISEMVKRNSVFYL